MFISRVDQEKYPDVAQKYRFELVERSAAGSTTEEPEERSAVGSATEEPMEKSGMGAAPRDPAIPSKDITELLMDFYDASTYDEKYNILTAMRDGITDVMIDNMAVVLDVVIPEGELDKRYEELKRCLKTHRKFETTRG